MKVIGKSNVYIISFAEPIPTSRSTTKGEFYLLFSFCFILEKKPGDNKFQYSLHAT